MVSDAVWVFKTVWKFSTNFEEIVAEYRWI